MFVFIFCIACTRVVDRAQWQQMSPHEKTLYVRSLLGAEKVKERKGGNERTFPLSAEAYVRKLDAAYAHGDQRPPDVIFETLGSLRVHPPLQFMPRA